MAKIDLFAQELEKKLANYSKEVISGMNDVIDKQMEDLVNSTKNDAPVNRGKYRNAISSKVVNPQPATYRKQWYVQAPEHRLSHLLNNGHAKRGGGRVRGDNHITKNEKRVVKACRREIEEVIRNAGR